MRVLVVGGGMAGLCSAIALGRAGHRVTVAEPSSSVDGAVIAITNRAVDALEALGVLDEVAAQGFVIGGTASIFSRVFEGAGDPLPVPEPPPRNDTRLPASISLLRPDFSNILARAAEAQRARPSASVAASRTSRLTSAAPSSRSTMQGARSSTSSSARMAFIRPWAASPCRH